MTPAERGHTKRRLAERYGLEVSSADLFRLSKRIAHGQAQLISRQSRDVAQWQIEHAGQTLRVVFDHRRRSLLTALPKHDSAEYLQRKLAGAS